MQVLTNITELSLVRLYKYTVKHRLVKFNILPSIFVALILHRLTGNLETIPGYSGHKEWVTLAELLTHRRAQSHTFTHPFTFWGQF